MNYLAAGGSASVAASDHAHDAPRTPEQPDEEPAGEAPNYSERSHASYFTNAGTGSDAASGGKGSGKGKEKGSGKANAAGN
eukprot:10656532-Karenia_brevis.AAC.1